MNANSPFQQSATNTFAVAALAGAISIGLLSTVAAMFLHDGAPFGQVVAAEHACGSHAIAAERQDCIRTYPAPTHSRIVASR
jgi:hypothetical protein